MKEAAIYLGLIAFILNIGYLVFWVSREIEKYLESMHSGNEFTDDFEPLEDLVSNQKPMFELNLESFDVVGKKIPNPYYLDPDSHNDIHGIDAMNFHVIQAMKANGKGIIDNSPEEVKGRWIDEVMPVDPETLKQINKRTFP
jgi:hypothetical protein